MKLPLDPDGMNTSRSEWARSAIKTFQKETRTDVGDALCDLLADLMHWADRNGFDFQTELARATTHYVAETSANIDMIGGCRVIPFPTSGSE